MHYLEFYLTMLQNRNQSFLISEKFLEPGSLFSYGKISSYDKEGEGGG